MMHDQMAPLLPEGTDTMIAGAPKLGERHDGEDTTL